MAEKDFSMATGSDTDQPVVDLQEDGRHVPTTDPEKTAEIEPAAPTADAQPCVSEGHRNITNGIPDGGLQAWLQVLGAWAIMVETFGLVNTFGVYQTYYETRLLVGKQGGTATQIAWIGSLQAALLLICGIVGGPLYDAGYFRHLVAGGLFFVVFGLFMTSLCTEYWQIILAQGITMGIGMGLCFTPSNAVLAQYFHKKRPLVIGISSSGSPLAGIVFPILFARMEPRIGFGWTTRIIAFILLGLAIVPIACMRPRVAPTGKARRALFDKTAFKELPYVGMLVGSLFSFMCVFIPFFFVQLFGERRGIDKPDFSPFYLVTMMNLGSFFGRLLPNAIAVRYGSVNLIILCTGVSSVLLFGWMGIASQSANAAVGGDGSNYLAGTVVFALLYGLFSGGIVGLIASVIIGLTKDLSRVGTRMGMAYFFTGIACLIGPPIAGSILGDGFSNETWLGTIGFGAACVLIATLGFSVTRWSLWRQDRTIIA